MKNLMLLLGIVFLFASCKLVKMGNPPEADPKPFVELKGGKKIDAENVKKKDSKIIADGKTYDSKSVSFYSNGENIYGYTPRRNFAKLTFVGDINVYKYTSTTTTVSSPAGGTTGGTTSFSKTTSLDYIQKNGSKEIMYLKYKTLKQFIPPTDLGYGYVKLYKKNRIISNVLFFSGLTSMFTGLIIAGNNFSVDGTTPAQARGQRAGGLIAGAGGIMFLSAPIIGGHNKKNMQKAIGKHNKVL